MPSRIVVIGGGIGGLASAYRLRQRAQREGRDVAITVLESGRRWGGVIRTTHEDGCVFEHGPDSIVTAKPAALDLIRELGLEGELQPTEPEARRALVARGTQLLPIPEGLYLLAPGRLRPFLFSPLVSWRGKLRMLLDLVLPRRAADRPEESLAHFVRRRLGREALERIAQPLVSGIYTADPERLSLAATMPQFLEMERESRSLILAMRKRARDQQAAGPRYALFVSLRGGLERLTEALVAQLAGCDLRLDHPVTAVARAGEGFMIQAAGTPLAADQVVLALPAHVAASLCAPFAGELAEDLAAIPYAGVVTVNLVFARDQLPHLPAAAGFVVPAVEGREVIACTFASRKYSGRAGDDCVLLRAFVGGALHEEHLQRGDPDLLARVIADLRDLLGATGHPRTSRIHRWPRSMAQYVVGHGQRVRRIREREALIPGLALVGNGYEGVGIPDVVAQAERAAERLAAAWPRPAGG